jgi:hypothetical protein
MWFVGLQILHTVFLGCVCVCLCVLHTCFVICVFHSHFLSIREYCENLIVIRVLLFKWTEVLKCYVTKYNSLLIVLKRLFINITTLPNI